MITIIPGTPEALAVRDEYGQIGHVLAHRLKHDAKSIAEMRTAMEVLRPIVDQIDRVQMREYAARHQPDRGRSGR